MTNRTGVTADATSIPALTALAAVASVCAWCRKTGQLRRAIEQLRAWIEGNAGPKYGCDTCLSIVERGLAARLPGPAAQPGAGGCPPWCDHERAHRFPIDVEHESTPYDLASTSLAEGEEFGDVCASIYQQPGEAPRVSLSIHTHHGDAEVEMTPEEALQVAYGLINKAMTARAGGS